MADPVAFVERRSKNYSHRRPEADGATLAAALTGNTKVGERYTLDDGSTHIVTAVNAAGVPTIGTFTVA